MDKFLNKFVKVFECEYNYLVTIGDDIYEMSWYPALPNGVNMYLGKAKDYIIITNENKEISLSEVSDSMKIAIVNRIWQSSRI